MVATGTTQSNQAAQFDLKGYLSVKQQLVEAALDRAFPVVYPDKIYEAMRYSLFAGGKRLRPVLCLAACDLFNGTPEMSIPTACALEMIHTMSLIHDDLPAMDNDDYRRGKLTNHKFYGEAVAILAGDGLLAYAFEHIVEETRNVSADRLLKVISRLGRAAGAAGLVGGQVVDLECEGVKDITLDTLNFIHTHKTAALLEASVVSGGILAGGSESDLQRLSRYSQAIGLAFQIVDDLLDITSTQEELGKSIGKDANVEKATYPRLLGMEESKRQAQQLIEQAKAEVAGFGEQALPLMAIADYITARKN
ncbi:polyprenyl synthetase family protein [Leptolyngbya boryana CZ1]|uniref:dimethylallyltranstransferase n=1 Tax=Leptolyngbya boryana CZ1 TaxID=3060204 RepID=A0AA97AMN6_LEPBY|nr:MULTISPECIES: farnesyl diphosphate synthase [Leptolyngbya]MBD1859016.1 polyprenyl synthetase family protein [Leptolyngbya sp. FACHB-1624]MBN8563861.1 polyprenyl synthetase family protein [Leptolyngbya sp. UWPOB_LEPTO1]WNZ44332.1 polyprenyl synthetase family protein [Leptolyngbya boryana CZ1]